MQQRVINNTIGIFLLTGASGGIGAAIAKAAARSGFSVVLCCNRNIEAAQKLYETIIKNGGAASVAQADLAEPAECGRIVADTVNRHGRVDVLVNNAGFLRQQPFEDIPPEEWDFTFAVNLRAPFLLAQAAFPVMRRNGGGHIINIASSGGQLGGPLAPHYAASKAGLICLTRSLARLGAVDNIITHAISPGLIATGMSTAEMGSEAGREKLKNIPLGRPGSAEEVAELVLAAALGKMDYATGQTINLNGGLYMG
jgi:acetoacetyl-CoA reductase/3-oxoacyl-[acyl-carrier protein] reductase